jgi:hypothetical protein
VGLSLAVAPLRQLPGTEHVRRCEPGRTLIVAQQPAEAKSSEAAEARLDDHTIALEAALSSWLRTARPATLEQPTGSATVARLPTCERALAGRLRPDEYAHHGCGHAEEAGEMYHVKATRGPWNPRVADIGKSVESC